MIPVFGCGSCLEALYGRLKTTLEGLSVPYELVFVDDRSRDGGWDTLRDLASNDHLVRLVRLSRDFGQHAAITAGLADCRGHWAVVMDCDLQDPPEEIPRLYQTAQLGYDVVLGRAAAEEALGVPTLGRSRTLLVSEVVRQHTFAGGVRQFEYRFPQSHRCVLRVARSRSPLPFHLALARLPRNRHRI